MERVKQIAAHFTSYSNGLAALERKSPDDVVITFAKRSPLTKAKKGGLKDARVDELMLEMFKHTITGANIDPAMVGDICVGTVLTPDANYHARAAALAAGYPESVPIQTINRFCSSGLMAVTTIANQIRAGQIEVGLAIGVESMSQNPDTGGPSLSELISCNAAARDCTERMGWTSENVAADFQVSRKEQDEFAAISFQRAEAAQKAGYFEQEIVPFAVFNKDSKTGERTQITVTKDDGIRYGTTAESLSKIRSAFPQWGNATTTGGNASQITDGAASVLLMTRKKAESLGLPILAKYITTSVAGVPPRIMGVGPAFAIPMVLRQAGISQDDVDLFEINEAFASQCLYTVRKLNLSMDKVNVNGGAIAFGHPLGCTGARQIATGLNELERRKGKLVVSIVSSYQERYANSSGHQVYGSGGQYYNESSQGFITPARHDKKRTSNWIKFGIPILLLVIAGGVVGAILATRKKSSDSSSSSSSGSSGDSNSDSSDKIGSGRFATATNSEFMMPIYPSTTDTARFSSPTFAPNNALAWPSDPFSPSSPDPLTTRPDRPRLIAPAHKWAALPNLIAQDPYLHSWNDTIFLNASQYYPLPPVRYVMDGPSGILDNAREVKMRIKAFSYVYRMTNDTKWADRTWAELQNAAGNGTTPFGPDDDKWNSNHFLDVAEFSAAFGIAYDWLYDIWTDDQKSKIISTLIKYGLQPGITAYTPSDTVFIGWWKSKGTLGNWNCVCNSGLTMAALAILGDDQSGLAKQLLGLTIDNAKENCAMAPSDDGTWAETANYWYFGTTGHAEMTSSLMTATGSHYGLLDANPNFEKTGDFHMHVTGPTSLFNWGDHGPGKFSTTANSMIFYGQQYNQPQYALFQRDQRDAAEPWSMFWYDATMKGAFWNGKELDHFFDNGLDQWGAMRTSWTDINALYVAIKAGKNLGHQTHNDLDCGDFVLDAMGTRWAGELGSADYTAPTYFSSDAQGSDRWKWYRKMTEGQNTILIAAANQNVDAAPTIKHDSSGTLQGSSTVADIPKDSTAFFTTDMTSAYFNATSVKRGIRLLNGRKQVLLQDEINASAPVMWRMHTNATVSLSGTSATLKLDGQTMEVSMLNPPDGAQFTTADAKRLDSDVTPPTPDQENPGVTVLIISLPAGTYNLQVLFNPQWKDKTDFVTPPSVNLDNWSLRSHD
ncbi:Thiolase, N-terminal domain-containing protein [Favolaschia claudopus]|uniref:Thiolase, N-terminal domain-containing protein n=1 Tax=Favolaschia claudopus TaxID=2862362 RepID=A0AAW0EHY6_9AGAR